MKRETLRIEFSFPGDFGNALDFFHSYNSVKQNKNCSGLEKQF